MLLRLPFTVALVTAAAVVLIAATGAPARAEDDIAAARENYTRGLKLYDLQRFREAAKSFEAAYEAKPDPAFLYNIAQSYRLAGEKDLAIGAYRSYLRRMPVAKNRAEVDERIGELQKAIDVERRTREANPSGTLRPTDVKPVEDDPPVAARPQVTRTETNPAEAPTVARAGTPRSSTPALTGPEADKGGSPGLALKVAGGAVAGVGVALVATGIAMGALAGSASGQLTNATPGTTFDPALEESFKQNRTLAIALVAAGGAATVAGAVVLGLGFAAKKKAPVAVLPMLGPERAGASVSFDF